jgi:hypothetical protein
MKNNLRIFKLFFLLYFITIEVNGQINNIQDSSLNRINEKMRFRLNQKLTEASLDTSSFVAAYAFKFGLSDSNNISVNASENTPKKIKQIVCEEIIIIIKEFLQEAPQGFPKNSDFVLPIYFMVYVPGTTPKDLLTSENLVKLFDFDDSQNKEAILKCLLLPAYCYQTPHYRTVNKYEKHYKARND